MKLVEYRVVYAESLSVLVHEVNLFVAQGWLPIGGVASAPQGFYQAIGRYQ